MKRLGVFRAGHGGGCCGGEGSGYQYVLLADDNNVFACRGRETSCEACPVQSDVLLFIVRRPWAVVDEFLLVHDGVFGSAHSVRRK